MSVNDHILEKPLQDALSRAKELDKQGIPPTGVGENFHDHTPTNVELVKACTDFYHKNQDTLDRAVRDAVDFLDSPDGVAYLKALEGAMEGEVPNNPLSIGIASDLLREGAFDIGSSAPQGLRGFGIGVSAGVSAVVGLLVGADVVFDFKDTATVHGRTWVGGSVKGGLSASAGLEMSFWVQKPMTGAIRGLLLDMYIPTKYILAVFIRFMYIEQRAEGTTEFDFAGVSLQFPFGIGFPIRHDQGKDGALAVFGAAQRAYDRPRRATVTVVNKATGISTIAVKETATLEVALKNTSGNDVNLSSGATMTISMPQYFEPADVAAMGINYPGWSFADVDGKLTLTLSKNSTWTSGSTFDFVITNVKSSNQPPVGQQSTPGKVSVGLNDISFTAPILTTADFSLVWANSMAKLEWAASVSADLFKLTGDGAGTVTAYAEPGNDIVTLTTAVDKSGATWILGYIFNYNTAVGDKVIPQVTAAWWKEGTVKVLNKTVYYSTPSDTSGTPAKCYYGGTSSSDSFIQVTPSFSTATAPGAPKPQPPKH